MTVITKADEDESEFSGLREQLGTSLGGLTLGERRSRLSFLTIACNIMLILQVEQEFAAHALPPTMLLVGVNSVCINLKQLDIHRPMR